MSEETEVKVWCRVMFQKIDGKLSNITEKIDDLIILQEKQNVKIGNHDVKIAEHGLRWDIYDKTMREKSISNRWMIGIIITLSIAVIGLIANGGI